MHPHLLSPCSLVLLANQWFTQVNTSRHIFCSNVNYKTCRRGSSYSMHVIHAGKKLASCMHISMFVVTYELLGKTHKTNFCIIRDSNNEIQKKTTLHINIWTNMSIYTKPIETYTLYLVQLWGIYTDRVRHGQLQICRQRT